MNCKSWEICVWTLEQTEQTDAFLTTVHFYRCVLTTVAIAFRQ